MTQPFAANTVRTGSSSSLMIQDDFQTNVDFYILGVNVDIPELPWTFTINGQTEESVRSFHLRANNSWQKIMSFFINTTQIVQFSIGDSGNVEVGGPTAISTRVVRNGDQNVYSHVTVGTEQKTAVPYVNVDGTWKPAVPWVKAAGEWKRTM